MAEDILREFTTYPHISSQDLRLCVDNEVLILLQEELKGMGTCLEKFGLPTPNKQNRIQKIPRIIQEELFDVDVQKNKSQSKYQSLIKDQHDAFLHNNEGCAK